MVLDIDVSNLTAAEQRMLAGIAPLLDPAQDGVIRVLDRVIPGAWRLLPSLLEKNTLELLAPNGAVRARLSRPIVLGALKRMLHEARSTNTKGLPALRAANAPLRGATAGSGAPAAPAKPMRTLGNLSPVPAGLGTDSAKFVGNADLSALLLALMQSGPGVFDLRFTDGALVRIDRGNNSFRCRSVNRAQLADRLEKGAPWWAQLPIAVPAKSEETQASMGVLLFALGVATAKAHFLSGHHTEREFQVRSVVAFARQGNFQRIAEAFNEFNSVADIASRLSLAPADILACLNGYAALGLLQHRARDPRASDLRASELRASDRSAARASQAAIAVPTPAVPVPGLLARIKNSLGV
jgi:hypothetical protein